MKKRLFLTLFICLILGTAITGCYDPFKIVNDKAKKAHMEQAKDSFRARTNIVYLQIMNPEPDEEQEALFIKEYTNRWLAFSEIMSKTDEVAAAIQEELFSDVKEELENISVYITIDNNQVEGKRVLVEFKENE